MWSLARQLQRHLLWQLHTQWHLHQQGLARRRRICGLQAARVVRGKDATAHHSLKKAAGAAFARCLPRRLGGGPGGGLGRRLR